MMPTELLKGNLKRLMKRKNRQKTPRCSRFSRRCESRKTVMTGPAALAIMVTVPARKPMPCAKPRCSVSARNCSRRRRRMKLKARRPRMIQPMTTRATALSMRSKSSHPTMTPAMAGGIMGTICRQLPPLRLIRKPRRSATISSGRTSPTEGLAPKIHAMMTTLSVAVPARPDFDSPMHIAPKRARSSIQPLAGRRVWAESQSSIRRYLPAPVSNTKTSNGSSVTVTFSPAARRKVRRRWSA